MSQPKLSTIKQLIKHPNKKLGQNFLCSGNVLDNIINAAELHSEDIVLEVGPGTGILTRKLAERVDKVIAIEKDRSLTELLFKELEMFNNIEIINEDILDYEIQENNYKVVANLPYYITNPIIMKFLESNNKPELMVLMVQKEVGQRICSNVPNMSKLSVFSQLYSDPEIVGKVSKNNFWPKPKVDSVIIRLRSKEQPNIDMALFSKLVNIGFSHPRKQLLNNFSKQLKTSKKNIENWLLKNNIKPNQRAETLQVNDWIKLTNSFILLD